MFKFNQFNQINEGTNNTSPMKQDLDDFFINYLDSGKAKSRIERVGIRTPNSKNWESPWFMKQGSVYKPDTRLKYWLPVYEYSIVIESYLSKEKIVNIIEKMKDVVEDIDILSYEINLEHSTTHVKTKDTTTLRLYFSQLESEIDIISARNKTIVNKLTNLGFKKDKSGDYFSRSFRIYFTDFYEIIKGGITDSELELFYKNLLELMTQNYEPKSKKKMTWQEFCQKIATLIVSIDTETLFVIEFKGGSKIYINVFKSGYLNFSVSLKPEFEKQVVRVVKKD